MIMMLNTDYCYEITPGGRKLLIYTGIIGLAKLQNVTGPAKIDHVSAKKLPIFSVFAVS